MKKITIAVFALSLTGLTACKKGDVNGNTNNDSFETLETSVLTDFTNVVALPGYSQLEQAAGDLNNAIQNLNADATETNLTAAKSAWKNMRGVWEKCEGYLFGPVEDNDYDPNMDTWPTDYVQLDSLLAGNNPLGVNDIQNITLSLRGYHPIEYIIFGNHGSRTAASITARQKTYMVSLTSDLKNTCHQLYLS